MVSMGLLPRLVLKVPVEAENIRALILSTLSSCIEVNAQPVICDIAVLRDQLSHQSSDIHQAATSALVGIR